MEGVGVVVKLLSGRPDEPLVERAIHVRDTRATFQTSGWLTFPQATDGARQHASGAAPGELEPLRVQHRPRKAGGRPNVRDHPEK